MAPGGAGLPLASEDILSTFNDGRYTEIAGTSQAAPHVAGVAALLVERGLRGQDVVRRIRATASDAGPPGPDAEYGAGIVNARAAVSGLPAPPRRGQIAVRADQRASYLRRKGLRIRCVPPEAGRCVARVSAARRVIATGSARTGAGRAVTVVARLTREGRRLLARTRRVRALVQVSLPGSPTLSRRITIRR